VLPHGKHAGEPASMRVREFDKAYERGASAGVDILHPTKAHNSRLYCVCRGGAAARIDIIVRFSKLDSN